MSDRQTSIYVPAATWLDGDEWANAPEAIKRRFLDHVGELAIAAKNSMSARGVDIHGESFQGVNMAYRKDHATGKPLDPHYAESRVVRWLRSTTAVKQGRVTLFWSHGWARIMGYHAYRLGPRALPVRNAIGFDSKTLSALKTRAISDWKAIKRGWTPAKVDRLNMPTKRQISPGGFTSPTQQQRQTLKPVQGVKTTFVDESKIVSRVRNPIGFSGKIGGIPGVGNFRGGTGRSVARFAP